MVWLATAHSSAVRVSSRPPGAAGCGTPGWSGRRRRGGGRSAGPPPAGCGGGPAGPARPRPGWPRPRPGCCGPGRPAAQPSTAPTEPRPSRRSAAHRPGPVDDDPDAVQVMAQDGHGGRGRVSRNRMGPLPVIQRWLWSTANSATAHTSQVSCSRSTPRARRNRRTSPATLAASTPPAAGRQRPQRVGGLEDGRADQRGQGRSVTVHAAGPARSGRRRPARWPRSARSASASAG
jgi:hypothetical protein